MQTVNIFWFRRDLRLYDNAGLYQALKSNNPVVPIFIFDKHILDKLDNKADSRVEFIHTALQELQFALQKEGSSMEVFFSTAAEAFGELLTRYKVEQVFANHDYEPYARERDSSITATLNAHGASFHTFKDQVIFEKGEIVKENGMPYTVFTPYSRKWKTVYNDLHVKPYPVEKYANNYLQRSPLPIPALEFMGFKKTGISFPPRELNDQILLNYGERRNYPALGATSKMGVHLRFGTVSIRQITRQSRGPSDCYFNELIWRDFYHMILWHFPQVGKGKAFKPLYDQIEWRRDNGEFEKWCTGQTGYPIVDAGMRELNATGFMHNRVRMIVASFLTKHLLFDWRLGEAYFAEKLLDFDLASNNGGWQWAAGTGCDAAPYFRIFNPHLQTLKFDPDHLYIKKWIPELNELTYPEPLVAHDVARKRCLAVYGRALKKGYSLI